MDNRSKVLNCAVTLFAQKGFDAVGVQELVDCAAITKPTLYHYFGNKRGVLDTIFAERFQPYLNLLAQAADYQHDLPLCLQNVLRVSFDFAQRNHTLFQLFLSITNAPDKSESFAATQPYTERQFQIIQELFFKAAQDHGNMKGRHNAYALTFIGMINTYIFFSFHNQIELNEDLIARSIQQFQYGIYS
jgi:TetR/AcrR family transcriptional regulator